LKTWRADRYTMGAADLVCHSVGGRTTAGHSRALPHRGGGDQALTTALVWWPLGMLLAAVYFTFAYRLFFRAGPPGIGAQPAAPQRG
jgi:hypothetical protein